jgi:DNA-binding HxlR family transcriptional regulator
MPEHDEQRIREALVSNEPDVLMQALERVAKHIRLVGDGMVDVPRRDRGDKKYSEPDRILLYLIGRLYAHRLGKVKNDRVCCQELEGQLGIVGNALRPRLKELREAGLIRETRPTKVVYHSMELGKVIETVERVDARYKGRPDLTARPPENR